MNDEKGFTLVQTLATLILISLLGLGLIMLAFQISDQITATQGISQQKNHKTFAAQEAKITLDKEMEELFSEENLKLNPLGMNDGMLRKMMTDFVNTHQVLNEGKFKPTNSTKYTNTLSSFSIENMGALVPGEGEGEQGWEKPNQGSDSINYYNYRVKIPVESVITEKTRETTLTSEYVYEVQWESKKEGDLVTETDIWGNMYYQINRPGGIQNLSADTMMRKMSNIYHIQDETPEYLVPLPNRGTSSSVLNGTYGIEGPYVSDMTAEKSGLVKEVSRLQFEGSFIVENGFDLKGNKNDSQIVTKNLLALTNSSNNINNVNQSKLDNVSIDARSGLYLGLDTSDNSRVGTTKKIIINNDSSSKIDTTNLVINHTIDKEDSEVGTYISNGQFNIEPTKNETTNYQEYKGTSDTKNLQRHDWYQYQKGNVIISNSKVVLDSTGSRSDISFHVANNFMLSNAGMSGDLEEDSFSYFEDEGKEKIKAPSELILTGSDTVFNVEGYSFIDAPKRNQRTLIGETNPEKHIYITNQGLNKISLTNGSKMELGFTGMEAFTLESERNTVFSAKLLPDLALFNSHFLEAAERDNHLQGKVVLETFKKEDTTLLTKELDQKNIPYKLVNSTGNNYSNCENGLVTIVENRSGSIQTQYQYVTRQFSYMTDVSY